MDLNETRNNKTFWSKGADVVVVYGICQDSILFCVTVTLTYFLLMVAGIVLNALVCYVMVRSRRYMKSMSCFLITHLGVVEIIYRVAFAPSLIYISIPSRGNRNPIACKVSYFLSSSCRAAIFGTLVVIAHDRYHNIVHPLSSLKRSKRPFRIVFGVWLYAIASSCMFLYTAQEVSLDRIAEGRIVNQRKGFMTCDIMPNYVGGISVTVSMVMTFVVPLVTIIIAYTAIFISLRRRCESGLVHKAAAKSKSKAAKMLVVVVSGFVVCWAPGITVETIRSFGGLHDTPIDVLVVASIAVNSLMLCSSLVNPLIYAFYSADFKSDFVKLCKSYSTQKRNARLKSHNKVSGQKENSL